MVQQLLHCQGMVVVVVLVHLGQVVGVELKMEQFPQVELAQLGQVMEEEEEYKL